MPDKNAIKPMTSKTKLKSFGLPLVQKKYSIIIKLGTGLIFSLNFYQKVMW